MSADLIPLPETREQVPTVSITPFPPPPQRDALSKLLKNPFVIAGGALLAGMAVTRLFATPPMRKLAHDLAEEALKRARTSSATPPPASLIEQGLEAIRPEVTDAAKRLLAGIFRKS